MISSAIREADSEPINEKNNYGPEEHVLNVRGGNEIPRREGGGGAEVSPGDEAEDNDHERGDPHGDGAEVVGPLGEVEAEDI